MIVHNNLIENKDLGIRERAVLFYLMTLGATKESVLITYEELSDYLGYKNTNFRSTRKALKDILKSLEDKKYLEVHEDPLKGEIELLMTNTSNVTKDDFSFQSQYVKLPLKLMLNRTVKGKYIPLLVGINYHNKFIGGKPKIKDLSIFSGCSNNTLKKYLKELLEDEIIFLTDDESYELNKLYF